MNEDNIQEVACGEKGQELTNNKPIDVHCDYQEEVMEGISSGKEEKRYKFSTSIEIIDVLNVGKSAKFCRNTPPE